MKQYLNIANLKKLIANLKTLTLLIGLISTLIIIGNGYGDLIFVTNYYSNSYKISLSDEVLMIFFCWSPYFFYKVFEIYRKNQS